MNMRIRLSHEQTNELIIEFNYDLEAMCNEISELRQRVDELEDIIEKKDDKINEL